MNILLIDDEIENIRALQRIIKRHTPHQTMMLQGVETLHELDELKFDLIISDQRMPDYKGTDLFEYLHKNQHPAQRILLSAHADFKDVVTSFNAGDTHRFLSKPVSHQTIIDTINEFINKNSALADDKSINDNFANILTKNNNMQDLCERVRQIAKTESNVCIYGETGSGKEAFAKALHSCSGRSDKSYTIINCASLTNENIRSQLFGKNNGAFAKESIRTLIIDEITELSPPVQSQLLQILQEASGTSSGSTGIIHLYTRIISLSSIPLQPKIQEGLFREDLFYRLNAVPLHIPPLRERSLDKELLFRHFLTHYSIKKITPSEWVLDKELLNWIMTYRWSGNIRELQNICAYIVSGLPENSITIEITSLPEDLRLSDFNKPVLDSPVTCRRPADLSADDLLKILKKNHSNKAETARQLGVSRMTLYRLIKKHDLDTLN